MLDEMEQVKRFLFDMKEAYDVDRHEWNIAKEEFKYQLEAKEAHWNDYNYKLNEIINVVSLNLLIFEKYITYRKLKKKKLIKIRALLSNESLPMEILEYLNLNKEASLNDELMLIDSNRNESLNNLVGGTSNLLELKLNTGHPHGQSAMQRTSTLSSSKSNLSNDLSTGGASIQASSRYMLLSSNSKSSVAAQQQAPPQKTTRFNNEGEDLKVLDLTKDRKELDGEFDQVTALYNSIKFDQICHLIQLCHKYQNIII